jgi:TPR repeat protein
MIPSECSCFDTLEGDQATSEVEVAMPKRLEFIGILLLLLSTGAFVQDAPLTDCDTYAASDHDSQHQGVGVPIAKLNPTRAVPACEGAASQYPNERRFAYQLGRAYFKANNFPAAVTQFYRAADQGYAAAQFDLGIVYLSGQGVPQDFSQAIAWFYKAADQGDADAQNNLGTMYSNGLGVTQDFSQAIAWFRKAAEQRNAGAQYNLGLQFEKGLGVPKDIAQAVALYRKAAEQGHALAQTKLAQLQSTAANPPMGSQPTNSQAISDTTGNLICELVAYDGMSTPVAGGATHDLEDSDPNSQSVGSAESTSIWEVAMPPPELPSALGISMGQVGPIQLMFGSGDRPWKWPGPAKAWGIIPPAVPGGAWVEGGAWTIQAPPTTPDQSWNLSTSRRSAPSARVNVLSMISACTYFTFALNCKLGEKICYAARSFRDPTRGWGYDPENGCLNCCAHCGSGELNAITLRADHQFTDIIRLVNP